MACTSPMVVYQDRDGGPIEFSERPGFDRLEIGCGRCVGCRLGRAQAWSVRCQHEAQLHDENSFVTLTYEDGKIPRGGSLHYPHVQAFLRALRKRRGARKVRFFCAGEYGDRTLRPHYHLLLFGVGFKQTPDFSSGSYRQLPESTELKELWRYGLHHVGTCTPASASYCARYALKKVYGRAAGDSHYTVSVDQRTGEVTERVPEFLRMSLRPAIGREWYEKFASDIWPHDRVVVEGVSYRVPRYYEKLFRERAPLQFEDVEASRESRLSAPQLKRERTAERRAVREEILRARVERMDERRKV